MTLLQVALLDDLAVLAADTRTKVGPPGGPFRPETAKKLFDIRGCAVASFGSNPSRVDVAGGFIPSFAGDTREPPEILATHFAAGIARLQDRGDFGLLICGVGSEGCLELWEVASQRCSLWRCLLQVGRISTRATDVAGLDVFPPILDPHLLQEQMLSIFRQAAAQCDAFGPPYEIATIWRDHRVEIEGFDVKLP